MKLYRNPFVIGIILPWVCLASEIEVLNVNQDLSNGPIEESIWNRAKEESIVLTAQPMALPRPKKTTTSVVKVRSIHNEKWISFRLSWTSEAKSEAGRVGVFSDAVAIQFPVKKGGLPPIIMGAQDQPVHILHWRAQYQRDVEHGKPDMKGLYPHMSPDMYPMEFKDHGNVTGLNEAHREVYSPARAVGNPQAYQKESAVDELIAEGFGSSTVVKGDRVTGRGTWKDKIWTVYITRPLRSENGSELDPKENTAVAFAIWQGGHHEVGSRKSLTISWIPLKWVH